MDCAWFNDPAADTRAQHKVVQLRTAKKLGVEVPATLVTTDPAAARSFVESATGPVVRKAFRNLEHACAHTHVVTPENLEVIDTVRFAPVIFQEYVPVEIDLRVTMVDGEAFAAAIKSDPEFHADYRPGLATASVTAYELPDHVADQLRSLCNTLGLRYGAIDLRLTPEGRFVFLEVNPGGEFLFVSDRTEQPVPEAIAAALARGTT
jgi:glutathione synthase/RimK-type ligase-like ATP-grasp enzyme